MSEAALFGIAKSILQVLGSPALDEFRLLWDQKKQLEKLQGTVATIRDVLRDADRRQASDAAVQGWLTRLRLVLYEADDLFDSIAAKDLHEKARTGSNIGKKVLHALSKPRNFAFFVKSSHTVKAIRERLDVIASDIKGFSFLPAQTEQDLLPYRTSREPTHSYVSANDVIGREKEREEIVKMLLPEGLQEHKGDVLPVVVVIGIGGLGKTTLAQLVRNDDRVKQGFDLCIWTCINYFLPLNHVLVELIRSATKKNVYQELDLDTLQSKFREVIGGKRFLLVLDDVWDENPQNWLKLKVLLNFGQAGSMVLATTRSKVVAQSLNATEPYYYLEGLSDESAWALFRKMSFSGKEGKHGRDLEELGRQIVKKCANVPLAIVTIGSLLRHKEKKEWVSLLNDELCKVVPRDYSIIMQILKISYDKFPYPVKSCFAYCSLFPKDHRFEKQKLVRLWIAQGFVESRVGNQSLEDIAEGYFMYLVERCFFQDMKIIIENGVEKSSCRMHDLVHDLAMEVAKLEIVLVDETTLELSNKTIRHVSIFDEYGESSVEKVCSFPQSKNLRTLLLLKSKSVCSINLNKLISCCRGLRVLDLSRLGVEDIPTSIGSLIHLRYLDLSFNYMKTLPSSICSLHHLQSLILQDCWSLKNLPKDLGKLLSLRHLVLRGCAELSETPAGLVALTSLVTLDKLIVEYSRNGLKYLECLENLSGYLEIVLFDDGRKEGTLMDVQKSCLSRNRRLDAMCIDFGRRRSTEVEDSAQLDTLMDALEPPDRLEYLSLGGFGGKRISAWVMRLSNLVTLTIKACCVCVELPPLSRLQSLKELRIEDMSSMLSVEGSGPYDPQLFFPSLETLTMHDMPNLRSWWLEEPIMLPTFPRLVKVQIINCSKLSACVPWFPYVEELKLNRVGEYVLWQGIGSGSSALKELEISGIANLRRIGEAQIRHLPALQRLIIELCAELETVSCRGLAYLTSLEELIISGCGKLKWVDGGDNHKKTEVLSRLEVVEIPNVNMWLFNRLRCTTSLKKLRLYNLNEEQIKEEEDEDGVPWRALQKLECLKLEFGEMTRNKSLLKGVENLTCLKDLTVSKCKELHMPWRALLSLKHLDTLRIEDVEKVIDVDYDSQIQLICSNLRHLMIICGSMEWVRDIPWKLLSSLLELYLFRITDMEALPDEIQHLTALQDLDIRYCERILSLPSWMSSFSSLRRLYLEKTSKELRKRCERGRGEDWPLIRLIPHLMVH